MADNKLSDMAGWDQELLEIELEAINLDMTQFGFEIEQDEILIKEKEKKAEVEFTEVLGEEHNYIVFYFDNDIDWLQAESLFNIEPKKNLSTRKDGKVKNNMQRISLGRVLNGAKALEMLREHYENIS